MTEDQRPLSPHLQIYRLPLTALLSITHRLTGLALVFGAVLLITVLLTVAAGPEAYAVVRGFTGSWFGYLVVVAFTFALYFHFCNGIRHLFWDAGYGFELETVDRTAVVTIVASVALTGATWLVAVAL